MRRHAEIALGSGDEPARVVVDGAFASEVAEKGPRGRQFPCGGRPGLALAMDVGKEAAKGGAVKARGVEIGAPRARGGRDVIEPLRQIGFVGANGVRGGVAVEREKLEEVLEVIRRAHHVRDTFRHGLKTVPYRKIV